MSGCILISAQPANEANTSIGGLLFEGDAWGGAVRAAGEVRPLEPTLLMASNNYWTYKAEGAPFRCNGKSTSFYTQWRYEVAQDRFEARSRVGASLSVDSATMKSLLQSVSDGFTEHALIWHPNSLTLEVAVASLEYPMWDASYLEWETFAFDDLFA